MAHIVKLSEYRKPAPGTARGRGNASAGALAPHYFCLRCDTDQFRLFPAGAVHCAQCGALMRNLGVSDSEGTSGSD